MPPPFHYIGEHKKKNAAIEERKTLLSFFSSIIGNIEINQVINQHKTSDPSDLFAMSIHQFSFNQVNKNLAGNEMKKVEKYCWNQESCILKTQISVPVAVQLQMIQIYYNSTDWTDS